MAEQFVIRPVQGQSQDGTGLGGPLVIEVSRDLLRKLEQEAAERGMTIDSLVLRLIGGWFRAHGPR